MTDRSPQDQASPRVCAERVHDGARRVTSHPCLRAGVVQRNGKWWCKQHDPEAVAARAAASRAKYDAKWAEIVRRTEEHDKKIAAYDRLRADNADLLACLRDLTLWPNDSDTGRREALERARLLLARLEGNPTP